MGSGTCQTAVVSEPNPIDRIVRPQPVAVRTVWPGEASHFTPWLSENLDWLDVLELGPLEHVGTEVPIPNVGRNLDILAKTPGGAHVAIENQYLKTDHDPPHPRLGLCPWRAAECQGTGGRLRGAPAGVRRDRRLPQHRLRTAWRRRRDRHLLDHARPSNVSATASSPGSTSSRDRTPGSPRCRAMRQGKR